MKCMGLVMCKPSVLIFAGSLTQKRQIEATKFRTAELEKKAFLIQDGSLVSASF